MVRTGHGRLDAQALLGGLAVTFVHLLFAGRYDVFRDELYFIVCGQHPAFGYVDQPPLVPLLAAGLWGIDHSVWLLRLPSALAAGALVCLAMRFVRLLGGDGRAAALAGLSSAIAPMLVGLTATLNTTSFDPLAWTAIAYCIVRAVRLGEAHAIILAGIVAGVDLQIKYALLFWFVSLCLGLLATPERRLLLRPAFWAALGLGAAIAVPSFVWQAVHGFPFLELGAAAEGKNADVALVPFLLNQVLVMNPLLAPLWLAGLAGPFLVPRLKDLRFLPIACLALFALVRLGHGKDYYLAAAYPSLMVLGAVTLVPLLTSAWRKATALVLVAGALALTGVIAPMALPILSPPALASWMQRTGLAPQAQEKSFAGTALPQTFADQLGWRDFTRQISQAWRAIPAEERASTAIVLDNYGEASALDVHGEPGLLPPALSGHNQYYVWGLRGQDPANLLTVERDPEQLRRYCRSIVVLGTTQSRWAMAYENGKAIVYCRGVTPPLARLWPKLKHFE